MLKAIETVYQGYRFRSRLEARWAVFFDALSIPYQYEKEGFDLDGTWYLPDFWLPRQKSWVEIKPLEEQREYRDEHFRLAMRSESSLLCVCGDPWPNQYSIFFYRSFPDGGEFWCRSRHEDEPIQFATGRSDPDELWVCSSSYGAICLNLITDDDRWPLVESPQLAAAYRAARQARFER